MSISVFHDAPSSAFADAVRVFACTRVDADDVAFVHEQRDGDLIAVFDLGGLRHVRGRIAAGAGLRFRDLLLDVPLTVGFGVQLINAV